MTTPDRSLVEHYCRAMGIPPLPLQYTRPEDFAAWIMCHVEWPDCASVGYRLGLCEAAEEARWKASLYTNTAKFDTLMGLHRDLLRMAGVDPARWEATRCTNL